MTTIYEEVEDTYTRKVPVRVVCDKCGAEIPKPDIYELRQLYLSFGKGSSCPEGGHKYGWQVEDLCDTCVGKLKYLLEMNGYRVSKLDEDW